MKKLSYLFVLFTLMCTSCSLDDDTNQDFNFEVMPITNVDVPESFVHGETYTINVSYMRPNLCYEFNDFAYQVNGNERTVAVVNTVYSSAICNGDPEEVTVDFDLTVTSTETHIFKFFQGEDHNTGLDQYHIVEVPVMDGRNGINLKN